MAGLIGWLLTFFILISLIGVVAFQLVCLTDLEFDYINPYDLAVRFNKIVLPEFVTQGVLCIVFLLTGHWFMFLLSLPYLWYNVRLYMQKKHSVDVTEIYNQLHWEKKQRLIKLGYLIVTLVMCLFWLLWTIGVDDDEY
ncbi:Cornichon domain-containing protein [Cephalotus follicularis]|uniref:Cornichon domain-containing protein n=1 Tax=Cephalotus follicularis TaxID=3775 RepID=A0A1Q3AWW7_CEPFO|nr:Cornichon domain-containing protein [Cephalotus follicularis]